MTETATDSHPRRDIPIWISIPIILICLGGGGWFVWWYFSGEPLARTVSVPQRAMPNNQGNRSAPQRAVAQLAAPAPLTSASADGVADLGGDRWSVKSGRVIMNVSGPAGDERILVNYQRRDDLVNDDQRQLMLARSHVLVDPATREKLKITDEQLQKLRELQLGSKMVATDADMEKLKAAWKDYRLATNRAEKQNDLLRVLREVSDNSFELTKKTMGERAEQVKTILTPEQLAEFKNR